VACRRIDTKKTVILSAVNASRSEAFTQSKDPEFASSAAVMQGVLTALSTICGTRRFQVFH
jgi:hypothetical protein